MASGKPHPAFFSLVGHDTRGLPGRERGKSGRRSWKLTGSFLDELCPALEMRLPRGVPTSSLPSTIGQKQRAFPMMTAADVYCSSRKPYIRRFALVLVLLHIIFKSVLPPLLSLSVTNFPPAVPGLLDLDVHCKAKDMRAGTTHLVAWAAAFVHLRQWLY